MVKNTANLAEVEIQVGREQRALVLGEPDERVVRANLAIERTARLVEAFPEAGEHGLAVTGNSDIEGRTHARGAGHPSMVTQARIPFKCFSPSLVGPTVGRG